MPHRVRVFWEPKLGNTPGEYEDAFWPPAFFEARETTRVAIADGATASSYARDWADTLVRAYGDGAVHRATFVNRLPELQAEWSARRSWTDLPWFAQMKLEEGAYAAFLGARITGSGDGRWLRVIAAGDCCIAHVHTGGFHCSFPLEASSDFTSHPALVSTKAVSRDASSLLKGRRERITAGDDLFLMTDSLAAWFLSSVERGGTPWVDLSGFPADAPEAFREWADARRHEGSMRNDDVTLAILEVG